MARMRIAVLSAVLVAGIQAASAADLALKPRPVHEGVGDHRRPREIQRDIRNPAAREFLFQEFLEWLKRR